MFRALRAWRPSAYPFAVAVARVRAHEGGPAPYGYSVKDKKLLVNELEARVVREAFDLFLMHRQQARHSP